jgi:hypothetical protein
MDEFKFTAVLPRLSDFKAEALAGTGHICAIYILFDEVGPVYVGQTSDVRRRLAQHRAEGRKRFSEARFYPLEDPVSRLLVEGALTLLLHPKYNDAVVIGLRNPTGERGPRVWEMDRTTIYRRRKGPKRRLGGA